MRGVGGLGAESVGFCVREVAEAEEVAARGDERLRLCWWLFRHFFESFTPSNYLVKF